MAKITYQTGVMPLNLNRIKQKLSTMPINWKMNVTLPNSILNNFEFENYCDLVEESLFIFWRQYKRNCPIDIEQVWYNFEGNNKIVHEFKILDFEFIKTDHRDHSKNSFKDAAIRVAAKIECKEDQKHNMLVKNPLTLSLSGSLVRNNRKNTLRSITFKSLIVDDGVVVKTLMEV